MVKFGVSLLLWTDKFDSESVELIPKVGGMGFEAVEIPIFDPAAVDLKATKEALGETGLIPIGGVIMSPERDPISDDPSVRRGAIDYLKACVDITAELGGEILCGPMYSPVGKLVGRPRTEEEWRRAVETIGEVADHAASKNVTLAIEPLNRFETYFLNTAEETVKLVEEIGRPNVKVHLDTFHMNIEEKSLSRAVIRTGKHLGHLHCSENDRGIPGTGHIDWEGLFRALAYIGYDRFIVLESFVPGIKEIAKAAAIWRPINPSAEAFARQGLAFLRTLARSTLG